MGQQMPGLFERLGLGPSLKRWQRALQNGEALSAGTLRDIRQEIRGTRERLDALDAAAQSALLSRLARLVPGEPCDWSERPAPWRKAMRPRGAVEIASPFPLTGGMTLFHDATDCNLSLRQEPDPAPDGAPFGIVFDIYRFDGSFVSLVYDLPDAALSGLSLDHYVAVHVRAERERPVEVYARLNVQHGPNVEQLVREMDFKGEDGKAEFDLAYTRINDRRIEKAWLDLILESPEMTRIAIRDCVVLRAPRADI